MEYLLFFIIVILLIFIGWREHTNDKKFHDMLDRLMSKSLQEYKQETAPMEENEKLPDDPTEDIDDAFIDIMEDVDNGK